MAQATLLGICSDNVVTILQPSSTIECGNGVGGLVEDLTVDGQATFNGGVIVNNDPVIYDASGLIIDGGGALNVNLVSLNDSITHKQYPILSQGGKLYYADQALANASDIINIAEWSHYVAETDVTMNSNSIVGAKNISALGNITTAFGTVSGYSLAVGANGIDSSGKITGTSLSTNTGTITGGVITGTSLTTNNGPITGGVITGTSLTVGTAGISSTGAVTGTSFNIGTNNTPLIPPGSIMMYGGATAPSGWLLCDGAQFLQSQYPALFTALGRNTTPDMRGRVPVGAGPNYSLNQTGGSASVALTADNLPSHTHPLPSLNHNHSATDSGHTHPYTVFRGGVNSLAGGSNDSGLPNLAYSTQTTGTGAANINVANSTTLDNKSTNNNITNATSVSIMQPFLVLNYIIKT